MSQDPSTYAGYLEPQTERGSFLERLLLAAQINSSVDEEGFESFKVVEQLFPIESRVFRTAIGELMARLEDNGSTDDQVTKSIAYARRLLGLTMMPFIEFYFGSELPEDLNLTDSKAIEIFQRIARPWALVQAKHCTAYVVGLHIQEYTRAVKSGLRLDAEMQRIGELQAIIDANRDRPEAKKLVEVASSEYRKLLDVIERRIPIEPSNPRALSYLLTCCPGGHLSDYALAALILKGNSSPSQSLVTNPMQVLEVSDVAEILGKSSEQVTNNVSKVRKKAEVYELVSNVRSELDPRNLWVHVEPDREEVTKSAERSGKEG